jgi:hypothetical protein
LQTDGEEKPYKIWMADLLECPGCGNEIVTGFGKQPVSEHYMPELESWMQDVDITIEGRLRPLNEGNDGGKRAY